MVMQNNSELRIGGRRKLCQPPSLTGLRFIYETKGSGSPLLMFAPGGFDATIDKWIAGQRLKEINAPRCTRGRAYGRHLRSARGGQIGGRVERLGWGSYTRQAKALLDHLRIDSAVVMGGCMGCSVALAFGVHYPESNSRFSCSIGRW